MVKPLGTTYHVSWIHRLVQGSDIPGRVRSWIHHLVQGSDIPGRVYSWIHRLVQGSDIPGRVRLPHTGPITGLPSEVRVTGRLQSAESSDPTSGGQDAGRLRASVCMCVVGARGGAWGHQSHGP